MIFVIKQRRCRRNPYSAHFYVIGNFDEFPITQKALRAGSYMKMQWNGTMVFCDGWRRGAPDETDLLSFLFAEGGE